MRCRDCKKEIPEVPVLFSGKRGPLCYADFRKHRRRGRGPWWQRLIKWVQT